MTRVDFVEDGKHIKASQWIQKEMGKFLVLIVPDEGFTDQDKDCKSPLARMAVPI